MMTIIWGETPTGIGGGPGGKPPIHVDKTVNNWSDLYDYFDTTIKNEVTAALGGSINITRTIMLDDKGVQANFAIGVTGKIEIPPPGITPPLGSGQEINITLVAPSGKETIITRGSHTNEIFNVQGGGDKVTLSLGHPNYPENSMITLDGAGSGTMGPLIFLGGSGPAYLNMYKGVTLMNNDTTAPGAAVYMNTGTFTMYGGDITGNKTASSMSGGGGVYNMAGTFDMRGGDITYNVQSSTSANGGGGVYSMGIFNMSGGTIGPGNNAAAFGSGTGGGGVYSSGTFQMSGGDIIGNTADAYGGGVYIAGGTNTIDGAGAVISDNMAQGGGGVCIGGGSLTMSAGTIGETAQYPGNTATGGAPANGGGVYLSGSANLTLNGTAAIVGNKADNSGTGNAAYGGGVYFNGSGGGILEMSDEAKITYNKAISGSGTARGGGVYIGPYLGLGYGFLYMSGNAEISYNIAESNTGSADGGGVCFTSPDDFEMNSVNPKINNNWAISTSVTASGGGVFQINGNFTMNAGEINGNTANGGSGPNFGGGVFVGKNGNAYFEKNGGAILGAPSNNVIPAVLEHGHAIFVEGASLHNFGTDTLPVPNSDTLTVPGSPPFPWEFYYP